jgi:hypothetical protein
MPLFMIYLEQFIILIFLFKYYYNLFILLTHSFMYFICLSFLKYLLTNSTFQIVLMNKDHGIFLALRSFRIFCCLKFRFELHKIVKYNCKAHMG